MTRIHFGPNVASDMLPLFTHPEQWPIARAEIATIQLYVQNILANQPNEIGVGPNTYPALCDVQAFDLLDEWAIDLCIEAGAVKSWSKDGVDALHGILTAIQRVTDAGGIVESVVLDEPKGAQETCGLTDDQIVKATCYVIDGIRAAGVQQVGLVEPYPYIRMEPLVHFFEALQQAGSSPSFWHLDVDRFGIRDQRLNDKQVSHDLKWAQSQCAAWGIPFGVVIFGQRVLTDAGYVQSALAWARQLHTYLQGWPDRLIVQSWEQARDGTLTLPKNLPESDATSHTWLANAIQEMTQ